MTDLVLLRKRFVQEGYESGKEMCVSEILPTKKCILNFQNTCR